MIESLYPNHEKLELFARNTRTGWKSWGMKLGKLRDLRERREQMEWDDPDRIGIEEEINKIEQWCIDNNKGFVTKLTTWTGGNMAATICIRGTRDISKSRYMDGGKSKWKRSKL